MQHWNPDIPGIHFPHNKCPLMKRLNSPVANRLLNWLCLKGAIWCRGHYSSLHDDVIKWKHFPRYWPFVRGIHRSPVNSPHKGQWRGALMFSLICIRINGWVNNDEAGDLRRHRAHYDVTLMDTANGLSPDGLSHYLSQCWILICQSLCHSSESIFIVGSQLSTLHNEFRNLTFKIITTSLSGQWAAPVAIVLPIF